MAVCALGIKIDAEFDIFPGPSMFLLYVDFLNSALADCVVQH